MSGFARAKRVTVPLDDKARARLVCCQLSYVSGGNEHSAEDGDSPCLSELVHGFLEQDDSETLSPAGYESDSDRSDSVTDCIDFGEDVLRSTVINNNNKNDSYRNILLSHVMKAVEAFSRLQNQKHTLRRKVMLFLRELGHNAAICKTKWDSSSSGGLTAGSYEFIDVQPVASTCQSRYIVDLEFDSQFEIARPTSQYLQLSQSLPRVFVGNVEDLKKIVKAMCDAAKRSMKSRELSLPPWRKNRFMQNKWLGPYRLTVNSLPSSVSSLTTPFIEHVNGVNCRCVGFDDAVDGRWVVRTR